MKTFRYNPQIGKSRHCVSFHDGAQTHADGSPFFNLRICGNKKKLALFLSELKQDGYSGS